MKNKMLLLFFSITFVACAGEQEKLTQLSIQKAPPPPVTATIKITDYCPDPEHRFSDLILVNESIKVEHGELRMDWDRDGLSNYIDNNPEFNIDYKTADTNDDGYSDVLMYYFGVKADKQEHLKFCPQEDLVIDADGDGLNLCEERFLNTYDDEWDTDHDGLPDLLEIRFGMNPHDANDLHQDPDQDGMDNYAEVKAGTNISETDSEFIAEQRIQYSQGPKEEKKDPAEGEEEKEQDPPEEPLSCDDPTEFTVSNIPLVVVSNGNLIRLRFFEQVVPTDGRASYFIVKEFIKVIQKGQFKDYELELTYKELKGLQPKPAQQ